MKKSAFTLAEILISLMILGVIASLTIPSLIQNTQKKEQVVQLKKGLSMINQAISMNYALSSEDLSNFWRGSATASGTTSGTSISNMLKSRLSVVATDDGTDTGYVRTQDGLTYFWKKLNAGTSCGATGATIVNSDGSAGTGACYGIRISTKNASQISSDSVTGYDNIAAATDTGNGAKVGKWGSLTGYYQFYAGADRVVPDKNTQEILNATDATKVDSGS